MSSSIRLGVIGSRGGSALISASARLQAAGKTVEWCIVADRKCGMEDWAVEKGITVQRIAYHDAESFSREAYEFFGETNCEDVLLLYTRRVASPLIDKKRVWNIHPSLLPSFRGLHGVKDAMLAGVKVIGATLHKVDSGLDTGQIAAQVAAPLLSQTTLMEAEHVSYLQKVWLILVWYDSLISSQVSADNIINCSEVAAASPGIFDAGLRDSYIDFISKDKKRILK